jgi:DNA topoisomerase III
MILLVAEKPSVATQHYRSMLERCAGESFAQKDGYLQGKNHCITWCVGHLITLAPFDKYPGYEGTWQLANLPMIPSQFVLEPIERTQKQLRIVQNLMQNATTIVNGADAGREGNLIFDLILDFTPDFKKKEIKRLWVNSYVAKELDAAWTHLELAEKRNNLSYAARLRQRADWMVGLNATRAYTLTAGRGKLISVGRVQTPTLQLIVTRDDQVENFQEHFSYGVQGVWQEQAAVWLQEEKVAWFDEEVIPRKVVKKCMGKPAELVKIDTKTRKQFPPRPFDLTELQKTANKRYKIKVQQVLDIAQILYEKKVITYPRTDSSYLPDAMQQSSYELAYAMASDTQKQMMRSSSDNFVFINSKKVTDHYAIIPTGESPNSLPDLEQKVYNLVLERFITAWMQPNIWQEYQADLLCEQEEFRIRLKKQEQEGYKALQNTSLKTDDADSEEEDSVFVTSFPDWQKGMIAQFSSLELIKKKKSKPKYYTEATLLAAMKTAGKQIDDDNLAEAMKDRGLGTPATQAGIIETLKKREFIEVKKNAIVSTERGRRAISMVDEHIKSPEMTGEWEYKLAQIEKGLYNPADFRDEIIAFIQNLFANLREKYGPLFEKESIVESLLCPKCGKPLQSVPWGYACEKECGFKFGQTIAGKTLHFEEIKALLTQKKTALLPGFVSKKGKEFSAMLVLEENGEVRFEFAPRANSQSNPMANATFICPRCTCAMYKNQSVVQCAQAACCFTVPLFVSGRALSDAELTELFTNKRTAVLQGFVKNQKPFKGALLIDENWHVKFDPKTAELC